MDARYDLVEAALGIIANGMSLVQRLPEDKQTVEWQGAAREWLDQLHIQARSGDHTVEHAIMWENGRISRFHSNEHAQGYLNHLGGPRRISMDLLGVVGNPEHARVVERRISVWSDPKLLQEDWARHVGPWHVPRADGPCCEVSRRVAGEPSPAVD